MSSQKQSHRYIRVTEDIDAIRDYLVYMEKRVAELEYRLDHPWKAFWERWRT